MADEEQAWQEYDATVQFTVNIVGGKFDPSLPYADRDSVIMEKAAELLVRLMENRHPNATLDNILWFEGHTLRVAIERPVMYRDKEDDG